MNIARVSVMLAACLIMGGCAVNYQQQRAQRLDDMAVNAETYAKQGRENLVGDAIHELLRERPATVKDLFARSPVTKRVFLDGMRHRADLTQASTPETAEVTRQDLQWSADSGALSAGELQPLQEQLDRSVLQASSTGTVAFDLRSGANFAVLKAPDQRSVLADRSIAALRTPAMRQQQLNVLVEYVKATNLSPAELDRIERGLDGVGLRRPDLQVLQPVFPQLVAKWQPKLFVRGEFKLKGGDRLTEDDLRAAFSQKFKGLDLSGSAGPAPVRITVEKVRQDERTIPESRDTVTYAQHQVDIGYAVLLMPRNASYLYEISRTGASIDYGYVVSVETPGTQRFEKVVRGTVSGEQVRCSNARVQNVFGGVQGADWVANSNMATRCHAGNGKAIAELREDVLREVADAAAQAPQLQPLTDAE